MRNHLHKAAKEFGRTLLIATAAMLIPTSLLGIDVEKDSVDSNWGVTPANDLMIVLTSPIKASNAYVVTNQGSDMPFIWWMILQIYKAVS